MSILAEHLFTREAIEARRQALHEAVEQACEEYRQRLKALLQQQHRALKRRAPTVTPGSR